MVQNSKSIKGYTVKSKSPSLSYPLAMSCPCVQTATLECLHIDCLCTYTHAEEHTAFFSSHTSAGILYLLFHIYPDSLSIDVH
jgi:hypothetical protein